jgi:hypothetical protein
MRCTISALALAAACGYAATAGAQEVVAEQPFAAVPITGPAELQQLAALGDAEFNRRIFAGAAPGRSPFLERFFPPGIPSFPLSHGFAGPQSACLQSRSPLPCRLYVEDLTNIQFQRQPGGGVLNNPLGVVR